MDYDNHIECIYISLISNSSFQTYSTELTIRIWERKWVSSIIKITTRHETNKQFKYYLSDS